MENSWLWMAGVFGVFAVSCATLIYTIISTYAIRGNELHHIMEMLQDLKERVERLENIFIKGGKD